MGNRGTAWEARQNGPVSIFRSIGGLLLGTLMLFAIAGPPAQSAETVLHQAASSGDAETVRDLLKSGADIAARDDYHCTALFLAALNGHLDVVELLVVMGADVNSDNFEGTPLHAAALGGHLPVARLLISKGARVDARSRDCGRTPLHYAAMEGNEALVTLLIDSGADINAENLTYTSFVSGDALKGFDHDNSTRPLTLARQNGHDELASLLVASGAR